MTQAEARAAAIAAGNSAAQVDAFIAKEGGARTSAERISSAFQPTPGSSSSSSSGGGNSSGLSGIELARLSYGKAGTAEQQAAGPGMTAPNQPGTWNSSTGAYNTANGQAPIAPQNYDRTPEPTATPAPVAPTTPVETGFTSTGSPTGSGGTGASSGTASMGALNKVVEPSPTTTSGGTANAALTALSGITSGGGGAVGNQEQTGSATAQTGGMYRALGRRNMPEGSLKLNRRTY